MDPELEALLAHYSALGLVEWAGPEVRITEHGRPYARNVAAAFDRHRS
jgi:coproporphyrinogen III oxidase-like Fe-S oxidoreductase